MPVGRICQRVCPKTNHPAQEVGSNVGFLGKAMWTGEGGIRNSLLLLNRNVFEVHSESVPLAYARR
jgi:hypothetical protein